MHRFAALRLIPIAALLLAAAACSGSGDPLDTPTQPPPTVVDTFTGTLTTHGGTSFPFIAGAAGTISAQLTTLTPDSTMTVGLSLGTWNGTTCQIVIANDFAVQGTTIIGQSSATGNFCVRLYDSAGTVAQTQSYQIQVSHP